jgi:hypothetical protein
MPNSFQRPAPSGRLIPTPREMVAACFGSSFASAVLAIGSEHWLDAGMAGTGTVICIILFVSAHQPRAIPLR